MSYRSLVTLCLAITVALFAWILLAPPLHGQQTEGEAAQGGAAAPANRRLEVDPVTRLEIDQESGDLTRLPFDYPFTVLLALGALDLGDEEPTLAFSEFKKNLTAVPSNLCNSTNRATFAGVTTAAESGKSMRKVRFIMPALDPNRYVLFCFQAKARISAQLSDAERQALEAALRVALERLDTEFDIEQFNQRRVDFQKAFEAALSSFARREGLGGTVKLENNFNLGDLQTDFHALRQSMVPCNLETLQRNKDDFVGRARILWESSVPLIGGRRRQRLDLASCKNLYETGLEEAIRTNDDNQNETIIDTIQDRLGQLALIDGELDLLTAKVIRAVQTRTSLSLAATIDATSAAKMYVSADAGFAFVPHLDQSVSFTGINVYLRPVNPPSVTPLGWGWKGIARRTSITIGITLNGDLIRKETIGGVETKIVDDLTSVGSPLFGIGFRVNPALRIEAGGIGYKQLETLISQTPKTEINWYLALSLDMDVASLFTGGKGSLFNGGSPPK